MKTAIVLLLGLAALRAEAGLCPAGTILRLDPRLDALVAEDARLEKLADGHGWVEGPLWRPLERDLLFSDVEANAIFRWREGEGTSLFLERSGHDGGEPHTGHEPGSNGLALDADGRLLVCEHGNRRITRVEADGRRTLLVDRHRGRRLNSPNDLVVSRAGDLYFTDPPFGLPRTFDDPAREIDVSGVYRLRAGGEPELLVSDLRGANGVALSPDEHTLYVANADRNRPVWMAYALAPDGSVASGRTFFDASAWTKAARGLPDGMAVDAAGNLFAAGPGGVHVFAPDATRLGTLCIEEPTSNAALGEDGGALFVTADAAVYRIRLKGPARTGTLRGRP